MKDKICLVTVGTTKFDSLIGSLNLHYKPFLNYLFENGYNKLIIQKGNGITKISNSFLNEAIENKIEVTVKEYFSSFHKILESSSLVISHGGAGTIFEVLIFKLFSNKIKSLKLNKKLFVVINSLLMDDHQKELVVKLGDRYLFYSDIENFPAKLFVSDFSFLSSYVSDNAEAIAIDIERFVELNI